MKFLPKFIFGLCISGSIVAGNDFTPKLSSAVSEKIVGGKSEDIKNFPWIARFFCSIKVGGPSECGSVIISQWHVITAAHCVNKFNYSDCKVNVGSTYRQSGGFRHDVDYWTTHHSYRPVENHNGSDLAVVKLETPIQLNGEKVKAINLSNSSEEARSGDKVTIAGWGWLWHHGIRSEELQSLSLKIIDKETCLSKFHGGDDLHGEFCAVPIDNDNKNQSFCDGDSGGPAVVDNRLVGIMAHSAHECETSEYPNVFTEVAQFRKWIDDQLTDQYPYVVSLTSKNETYDGKCAGAIISKFHILTSAKCVHKKDPAELAVRTGSSLRGDGAAVYSVSKYIVHQNYEDPEETPDDNIALVKLENSIVFDKKIKNIIIPESHEKCDIGEEVTTAGWNLLSYNDRPDQLQSIPFKILNKDDTRDKCLLEYDQFICSKAQVRKELSRGCQESSGMPVIYKNKLFGITSQEICPNREKLNYFIEVASFRKWINQTLKEI